MAHEPGRRARPSLSMAALAVAAALAGCGGGNPLDNPPTVDNPAGTTSGQKLSFAYYQRCVQPIFLTPLPINQNGVISTNTCAGPGCHDNASGAGGAFRVIPTAQALDVTNPANTPEAMRASDMYKNFYSAQASVVIGDPSHSRLLTKPLLLQVLHGGGLVFPSETDPNARVIAYWITHPVPQGQDEFSTAGYGLFTPPDPNTGACNTQ